MTFHFQRHVTEEEKRARRYKYQLLIACGIEPRKAAIFRDWTKNKVVMIALGEATPIR